MLTFHPLHEKAPLPRQGRFCFLFLILKKQTPRTLLGSDCLAAGSQEVCLEGKRWERGARGLQTPRNCWSGLAVGLGNLLGAAGWSCSPHGIRRSARAGTRGSCHCCASVVAMLEGQPLDLRSLHAGPSATPGRAFRPGARPTCAPGGLSCETQTRRGQLALQLPAAPAPRSPAVHRPAPRPLRARRS